MQLHTPWTYDALDSECEKSFITLKNKLSSESCIFDEKKETLVCTEIYTDIYHKNRCLLFYVIENYLKEGEDVMY